MQIKLARAGGKVDFWAVIGYVPLMKSKMFLNTEKAKELSRPVKADRTVVVERRGLSYVQLKRSFAIAERKAAYELSTLHSEIEAGKLAMPEPVHVGDWLSALDSKTS